MGRDVVLMGRFAEIGPFRPPHSEDHRLAMQALTSVGADALSHRPPADASPEDSSARSS